MPVLGISQRWSSDSFQLLSFDTYPWETSRRQPTYHSDILEKPECNEKDLGHTTLFFST